MTDGDVEEAARERASARMLCELGVAMLEAGQATSDVDRILKRVAAKYGIAPLQVVALPTVMIVQSGESGEFAQIGTARPGAVRLDQAAAIDDIVSDAGLGLLMPSEALSRLAAIRESKPRFRWPLTLLGYIALTVGFGLLLDPTVEALPVYVLLGAVVGALIAVGRRVPHVDTIVPVVAAFVATLLAALFLSTWAHEIPLRVVAPALVAFLPGLALTVGAVELTTNQVVAGASRVVYGISQLLLLAFGVTAGAYVSGSATSVTESGQPLGWWAPLVGLVLLAGGNLLFLSAPRRSFAWLLVSLLVTYGALSLGTLALGAELAPFVGALVVVPLARLIARFKTAPPPAVTMLTSFWLLVPGALGFIGLNGAAAGIPDGTTSLVSTGISVFAIAVGTLVSSALTNAFDAMSGRERR